MRIGIDTGGTYTDAVLYRDASEPDAGADRPAGDTPAGDTPAGDTPAARPAGYVVAKAKARTRVDLSIGIAEALDRILADDGLADPSDISLVSLSTTLATNALVEGVGGRVALVFIGFTEAELDRGGLREGLGDAPVIMAAGGHDSMGVEASPFDAAAMLTSASGLDVDAFAVAGQFSVRNPAHELAARDALLTLGKPVACGHELSAKLNGPKRALTCLLNARLIGLIAELCQAAETILAERNIVAPLMIVRGDGSLVSASFAKNRPIETILSGPAASLMGAGHLTGAGDVIVSDIGGTTTDVGVLRRGRPTVNTDGATVGGHRTMVEAVDMFTFGLGGDSEVRFDPRIRPRDGRPAALSIGPRRLTPIALLATEEPALVHRTLDGRGYPYRDNDTTFVTTTGRAGQTGPRERKILDAIGGRWVAVDEVATTGLESSALRALVGRGLVQLAGFTPSDAAHVLGLHTEWDADASLKAAELMAGAADGAGDPVMPSGKALAQWVIDTLIRLSAEAVLTAALSIDGLPHGTVGTDLVQRALDGHEGVSSIRVGVSRPLAGLGASAATYYPAVARLLGTDGTVPEHAEVANAVGAAIGSVRITRQITVSQPSKGQFRVHHPNAGDDLGNLDPAIELAVRLLSDEVGAQADEAGAAELTLDTDVEQKSANIGGRELFVEATITVVGRGRPRTS